MHKHGHTLHLLLIPIALGGISWITMLLWNALLPEIFGLPEIGFWQALGILVLSRILFGGTFSNFHMGGRMGKHKHSHHSNQQNMYNKWHNMSKDEKEEFINRMHNKTRQMRENFIDIAEDISNHSNQNATTQDNNG